MLSRLVLSVFSSFLYVIAVSDGAKAAEEIGSAVGLSPSAEGSVTGKIALGEGVVRDEVVRTGANGTLEIQFRDGTHLGLAPSSAVKLDEFVYSVSKSGDQVVFKLTKGAFRFATGSLPKSAYRIETPVASIGVRGTVLSLVTDRKGLRISVDEGAARVCAHSGGSCAEIDGSNRSVGVDAVGRITRFSGIVKVALGCSQSSGGSVFCFVPRTHTSSGLSKVQPGRPTQKHSRPTGEPSKGGEKGEGGPGPSGGSGGVTHGSGGRGGGGGGSGGRRG
jgi:hypothetical protein